MKLDEIYITFLMLTPHLFFGGLKKLVVRIKAGWRTDSQNKDTTDL